MSTLRCWSARNILDLYVDRRLGPRWTTRVEAHLPACPACRKAAREMEGLPDQLKAALSIEAPRNLAASILKELGSPLRRGGRLRGEGLDLREVWRLEPVQAAALAYCILLAAGHALPGYPPQAYRPPAVESEDNP